MTLKCEWCRRKAYIYTSGPDGRRNYCCVHCRRAHEEYNYKKGILWRHCAVDFDIEEDD